MVVFYIYVKVNERLNFLFYFFRLIEKVIIFILFIFYILVYSLRLFFDYSVSLFGNFDNLLDSNMLFIICFFYINLVRYLENYFKIFCFKKLYNL